MDSARAGELAHLKDVAAQWILKQHSGEWTEADATALARWIQAATTNRIAYLRARAAWQEASRLKVLGAGLAPGAVPSAEDFNRSPFFRQQPGHIDLQAPVEPRARGRRRRPAWLLVASVVFGVVSLAVWHRAMFPTQEYSTAVGVTSAIPLPDGSTVTLNTDSEIQVAVTETERKVELERGEAFFEVAKDASRPFVVSAGDRRIVVLGTKFSVRLRGEEVQVAVTEGRVRVDEAQIVAGAVARASAARVAVEQRPLSEVQELLSWRSGFVVFHETPLEQAAAEFNRYNERQIIIRGDAGKLLVSGNFKVTSLDSFVGLLEAGFPLVVERQGQHIVLMARASE